MAMASDRETAGRALPWRRLLPVIGLALLAPWIGEFLLGNLSLVSLAALIVLAPLYGCGALLIRESVRHAHRGWPTMIVLGIAYALFEEGLVTQFLFNPSYRELDLQQAAYVPALGIGVRLTVTLIAMHAIWSTGVAIALVEALVPARAHTPWLGRTGLAITGVVFLLGSALLFRSEYATERFLASPAQLAGVTIAILGLIAVAFVVGRPRTRVGGFVPHPWLVGGASLVASSLLFFSMDAPGWTGVFLSLALMSVVAGVVWWCSRHAGWGAMHRLALASGALLTYAWIGFGMAPLDQTPEAIDLMGNAIFAVVAVILLGVAVLRLRRAQVVG